MHRYFFSLALIITIVFSIEVFADNQNPADEYLKPGGWDFITNGPKTTLKAWDMSFSKSALPAWGAIFASTALLYHYDEKILLELQRWGRDLGLGNGDETKPYIEINQFPIIRGPTDVGSLLYYLGDGWMHTFIASGFLISGGMNSDNRALQTGSQIFNGMIYSTIPNQILKRSFGRESPYRRTVERGAWRPFPSFATYNDQISKYDAMPSGHVMTATMTWTVIDNNYPEYRKWIRPIAYTWVALLSFQMVNNGVHWASDYPLGIAMGYVFGKAASSQGRKKKKSKKGETVKSSWNILPYSYASSTTGDRLYGLNLFYSF